ncbi:MAG: aminoacyl-histidine dipeptidase [Suipraeoptans sp.]
MSVLNGLAPKEVFHYFEEISNIPRGTFNSKGISDYCYNFAKERGLDAVQDGANNVVIKKPGTKGYEDKAPVILQGHTDMVCEKRPGSNHDFTKDPIELVIDNGFIKAKDTTLGADNGIAAAMILAVLDSNDIEHPPIEAVFTVDEEEGMGGAHALDLSQLKGTNLINLDSEEEGIITAGCAGGYRFAFNLPIVKENLSGEKVHISLHGLKGGHSGQEIHEQRGNAHKLMGRLLNKLRDNTEFNIISSDGGSKDNVISLVNDTYLLVKDENNAKKIKEAVDEEKTVFDAEFMGDEPELKIDVTFESAASVSVFDKQSTNNLINLLVILPNGVQGYSRKLKGLVETSLNLGILQTKETEVFGAFMVRSSVESKKLELQKTLMTCADVCGAKGTIVGNYPAWQFLPKSHLRDVLVKEYEELFGKTPEVTTIHAGLECGLFIGKRPDLDCVSIGPEMFHVHSFNEMLNIESTNRSYDYLKAILKNM